MNRLSRPALPASAASVVAASAVVRAQGEINAYAAFTTPFGPATWLALDQSILGTGGDKAALKDGTPTIFDWRYVDGASALPSGADIKKMRPA